jgi:hypothetical protein
MSPARESLSENLPVQHSVPQGRLRMSQDAILGIFTNSARSGRPKTRRLDLFSATLRG